MSAFEASIYDASHYQASITLSEYFGGRGGLLDVSVRYIEPLESTLIRVRCVRCEASLTEFEVADTFIEDAMHSTRLVSRMLVEETCAGLCQCSWDKAPIQEILRSLN